MINFNLNDWIYEYTYIYIYTCIYIYINKYPPTPRRVEKRKNLEIRRIERDLGKFQFESVIERPPAAQTLQKPTPIEEFALRTSRMRAWRSFLNREMHPYQGFRASDVQNASDVLIFAFPNAPPSQISPFGHLKCERGAHFCIAKRIPIADFGEFMRTWFWNILLASQALPKHTPIEEFGFRTSRMRAWRSFLNRETHPYWWFRPSDL